MPFLTFEGIDGSGKSSLLKAFAEYLKSLHLPVEMTREPGGSDIGAELREILLRTQGATPGPEAELLIYEADRAQHVRNKIRPWLEKNIWVLSDRFSDSSLAFQGAGRKIKSEDVKWLNHFATGGLVPDLTVLVDCPTDISSDRIKKRNLDRFEKEKQSFHESVRQEYLRLAQSEPKRFFVLDSQESPEDLLKKLIQEVKRRGIL